VPARAAVAAVRVRAASARVMRIRCMSCVLLFQGIRA
jgi:hypothetical protein